MNKNNTTEKNIFYLSDKKVIHNTITDVNGEKQCTFKECGTPEVAWDVVNDTKENIENKASTNKIAGDIIGDAAIGIGSIAASAWTGAAIGTAIGGPVGTVVGAGIGFGASVFLSMVTDGIKFNKGDWNYDGKQDSVKDRIKSGIGTALDKIF